MSITQCGWIAACFIAFESRFLTQFLSTHLSVSLLCLLAFCLFFVLIIVLICLLIVTVLVCLFTCLPFHTCMCLPVFKVLITKLSYQVLWFYYSHKVQRLTRWAAPALYRICYHWGEIGRNH